MKFYLNENKVFAQNDETNRFIFYYGFDELTFFHLIVLNMFIKRTFLAM